MNIIPLTVNEIIELNRIAIEQSGGALGILNNSTLQNCCDLITNTFFGREQHQGLFRKAAALMECISVCHGFLDANKRTALLAVHEFLFINGYIFSPDNRTIKFSLMTARGELSIEDLEIWITSCSRPRF